ncbi:MAG: hypothetical protein D3904_01590, partial [Candidatus Electrothrix sp. EH2]|nr:hypothetical protein [Candidatus Electrothrix sp. EH2]
SEPAKKFFSEIDAERFTLVASAIVEAEIEPAPENIRELSRKYEKRADIVQVTYETLVLQKQYISSGIVTP